MNYQHPSYYNTLMRRALAMTDDKPARTDLSFYGKYAEMPEFTQGLVAYNNALKINFAKTVFNPYREDAQADEEKATAWRKGYEYGSNLNNAKQRKTPETD